MELTVRSHFFRQEDERNWVGPILPTQNHHTGCLLLPAEWCKQWVRFLQLFMLPYSKEGAQEFTLVVLHLLPHLVGTRKRASQGPSKTLWSRGSLSDCSPLSVYPLECSFGRGYYR